MSNCVKIFFASSIIADFILLQKAMQNNINDTSGTDTTDTNNGTINNNLPTPTTAPISSYTNPINGSTTISKQDWLNALISSNKLESFLLNVKPYKQASDSQSIYKTYIIDGYSWIYINFPKNAHGYPYIFSYSSLPYPQKGDYFNGLVWDGIYIYGNSTVRTVGGVPLIANLPALNAPL